MIITMVTMPHSGFNQILYLKTASLDGGGHFVPADVTPVSSQQITPETCCSILFSVGFLGSQIAPFPA